MMSPAFAVLANKSLPFSLYDFHLSGVSAAELAAAHKLPLRWVEERLEAVRLCLKFQVRLSIGSAQPATMPTRARVIEMPKAACR